MAEKKKGEKKAKPKAEKLLSKKNLKQGGRVMLFALPGVIGSQVGGALLKRVSASAAQFAARGDVQEAVIDTAGGAALAAAGLMVAAKVKGPAFAQAATPFVAGGVLLGAWAPVVVPRAASFVESTVGRFLPGSGSAGPALNAGTAAAAKQLNTARKVPGGALVGELLDDDGFDVVTPGGGAGGALDVFV